MSRLRYLARKIVWLAVTLYGVVTFNFVLFHLLPGNPVRLLARSGHLTPQAVADITRVYGLNHPPLEQYLIYLRGLLHGQLGISYTYRTPVSQLLGQYLGNTILLLAGATILTIAGGVLLGVGVMVGEGVMVGDGITIPCSVHNRSTTSPNWPITPWSMPS